jgi:hypothetical protein
MNTIPLRYRADLTLCNVERPAGNIDNSAYDRADGSAYKEEECAQRECATLGMSLTFSGEVAA